MEDPLTCWLLLLVVHKPRLGRIAANDCAVDPSVVGWFVDVTRT